MKHPPFTLHLPPHLLERFDVSKLLASSPERPWSVSYALLEQFQMRSQEKEFARNLLSSKSNLRLYRTNQKLACGDFVVIDMSVTPASRREALFIELKSGAKLSALSENHIQVRNWKRALHELTRNPRVLTTQATARFVLGGEQQVLERLRNERL